VKLKAYYKKHELKFIKLAKTSRNTLRVKPTYFLFLTDEDTHETGIGECSTIEGLSLDNETELENKLEDLCKKINNKQSLSQDFELAHFPAIRFGLETAMLDLKTGGNKRLYTTDFSLGKKGIPINGLIWMGSLEEMTEQIKTKIEQGFNCLKLKIGSHDFDEELNIIANIRKEFKAEEVSIRVDANGAFDFENALEKLQQLSELDIHSIEQPIMQGQIAEMAFLCDQSPLPIALDEELIGVQGKEALLEVIQPQYIILKPSLLGGFKDSEEWIRAAEKLRIGWWATSALESNIGLNAIAQWVSTYPIDLHQGLGTGLLYSNNVEPELQIKNGYIYKNNQEADQAILFP
jgi:o-succinylbenzoate synthase